MSFEVHALIRELSSRSRSIDRAVTVANEPAHHGSTNSSQEGAPFYQERFYPPATITIYHTTFLDITPISCSEPDYLSIIVIFLLDVVLLSPRLCDSRPYPANTFWL